MRKAFVVVCGLLLAAFILQFAFAAVGSFTKPADEGAYALHSVNGRAIIPALTLLTILFAALAKASGRIIGLTFVPLALVILQVLLAVLAKAFTDSAGASTSLSLTVAALHAVNGLIALRVVVAVFQAARRLASPAEQADRRIASPAGAV